MAPGTAGAKGALSTERCVVVSEPWTGQRQGSGRDRNQEPESHPEAWKDFPSASPHCFPECLGFVLLSGRSSISAFTS